MKVLCHDVVDFRRIYEYVDVHTTNMSSNTGDQTMLILPKGDDARRRSHAKLDKGRRRRDAQLIGSRKGNISGTIVVAMKSQRPPIAYIHHHPRHVLHGLIDLLQCQQDKSIL
jgi:hypothetical protein